MENLDPPPAQNIHTRNITYLQKHTKKISIVKADLEQRMKHIIHKCGSQFNLVGPIESFEVA